MGFVESIVKYLISQIDHLGKPRSKAGDKK
jgi:hypothetical protein